MKKIYVVQMSTNTVPARIVSLFTMYKYSHIAISFDKSCDVLYSFGRRNLYLALDGGFTIEKKNGKFFKKFNKTKCRVYEASVTDSQYDYLYNVISCMKNNQDSYKYDFLGIILRYIGVPITFKNKYVCSYFVAKLLNDSDICVFDKDICFVKPKDFEKIDCLNLIYNGKYLLYR